jgi:hypothetical protein
MPHILLKLSKYQLCEDNPVESLKLGLRSLLVQGRGRRFGPCWANQLAEWVIHLMRLKPTTTEDLTKLPFVTFGDLMDVISGYATEATFVVDKVFGLDTAFSRDLHQRISDHSNMLGNPDLSSAKFSQRFYTAQREFLTWAGIETDRELLLSAEWVLKS